MVRKKKNSDISIKVRNVDRLIKSAKKDSCCSKNYSCGGCWVFGSALAMILSYERSASILWAILHGVLSWFYVLFRAMQIWGWF